MILYRNLFCLIYYALRSIEGGFTNQTNSTRAFEAAMVISFLEILNLVSVWPDQFEKGMIIFIFIVLFLANLFIFYFKKKYSVIVVNDANKKEYLYFISITYILVSLVAFIVRS